MDEKNEIERCIETPDMFCSGDLKGIYYLTPLKHLNDRQRDVALAWKYKKFRLTSEPTNKFDKYACKVEKWDGEHWVRVGYIQRYEYQTIFTNKANELYEEAMICGNWDEMKLDPHWADIEEIKKIEVVKPEEIQALIDNQSKFKVLTDKHNYEWRLYLEVKR